MIRFPPCSCIGTNVACTLGSRSWFLLHSGKKNPTPVIPTKVLRRKGGGLKEREGPDESVYSHATTHHWTGASEFMGTPHQKVKIKKSKQFSSLSMRCVTLNKLKLKKTGITICTITS